ncbi:MAG TPA: SAM-dependent methyltransferase [Thermoanaerobaculaceae bacterium]|nr:SAM-dependent methyltransferase [Thermoanaerobaculaceae bacterium]HPS79292.1 SAM-dependent methyltransferase [Thermoanaerobaculaceae bacterium]
MNGIIAEVARRGRMTCSEYMELALYDPELGYYTRTRRGAGPAGGGGDFLTAPSASPVLARTLAGLLRRLAETTGEALCLAELGAGEGLLLAELLATLGETRGSTLSRVVAVERGEWARQRLAERCPGVETVAELAEVSRPGDPAVLFASELYDALPVHRVVMSRDGDRLELHELLVEAHAGALRWVEGPPSDPAITAYLESHGISLCEAQRAEVRLLTAPLHTRHLEWCGLQGLALIVDYGHPAGRLYDPRLRRDGTLVGYQGHRVVWDVLREPGDCDITAHVNFDDLAACALECGWENAPMRPLGLFLAMAGAAEHLPPAVARGDPLTPREWAELAAFKRVLAPSGMGSDLKVLAQGRGRVWSAYQALATMPPSEA